MAQTTDHPPTSSTSSQPSAWLATADQKFDWTRLLDPGTRSLVTTGLEIGDRAIRTINIVSPQAGA
jgi:hypothetical protein